MSPPVLAGILGIFSTVYFLDYDRSDIYRTHMARLYFAYSLILAINGAWMFVSAIVWPMVLTRYGALAHEASRQAFQRFNLFFNGAALLLIVIFGPCAIAYACKQYYDDLASGWLEGQASIFGVLVVFEVLLLLLNQQWDTRQDSRQDGQECNLISLGDRKPLL